MWTTSCLPVLTNRKFKAKLRERFEMTDLDACAYYLGMTVTRDRANRIIRLGQAGYVEKFLTEHGMWKPKGTPTPMGTEKFQAAEEDFQATETSRTSYQSAVGSLMYAMLGTRPDIAYAVSVVSRYGSNPNEAHWKAIKRIFRYLRHTVDYHLVFRGNLKPLSDRCPYLRILFVMMDRVSLDALLALATPSPTHSRRRERRQDTTQDIFLPSFFAVSACKNDSSRYIDTDPADTHSCLEYLFDFFLHHYPCTIPNLRDRFFFLHHY